MSSTDATPEQRQEVIDGLRDMADFLERHGDTDAVPASHGAFSILEFPHTRSRLEARMKELGGPWTIEGPDARGNITVARRFGSGARYGLYISAKSVTERLVQQPVIDIDPAFLVFALQLDPEQAQMAAEAAAHQKIEDACAERRAA